MVSVACLANYSPSSNCEYNHSGDISNFGGSPPPHLNRSTGYKCYGYGVFVKGRIYKCSEGCGAYDGGGF
jgi:hypothetical protein